MAENNVKKMYEYFSTHKNDKGNAFFGGTYDEFRESLADNNVRLNMYNHLSQANIFKGSIDEFDNELGFAQPHQIEQVQPQVEQQAGQPQLQYIGNQKKGFGQRAKDAVWGGTLKLGAGIIDAMSRFGAAQAQADAYKYGGLENQERVNEQVTQARESLNKGEGIGQKYLGTKADAISEENQQRYGYNEDGSAKGTMDLWREGKIGLGLEKAFMDGLASAPTTLVALTGPAGLVALGAGSAEQKYEQLKAEQPEMSEGAMITNAVLTGAFESATEYIGKLPILRNWKLFKDPTTEEVLREQIERLGQGWVKKYVAGTLKSLSIQMGQEAFEEATNAIAGMALDKATGVERGYSIDEVIDAAMAGAMGGATGGSALSGVGMGVGAYRQRKGRKAMVEYNEMYNAGLEQMGGQYNQWEASLDESVDRTALRQTLGNLATQYANGSLSRADLRSELINMGVKPSQMPTDSELLGLLAIEQDEADGGGAGWFAGGRKSKELKLSAYLNGYYGAGAQNEILGFMRQNNLTQEQFVDLMTNNKPTAEQVGLRNKFYESMEGHREAQQLRYKFLNKFCEENGVTEDQLDMMLQRRAQGIELKDWELELSNRFDEAMSNYEHENKIKATIDGKAQIAVDLIRRQTNNSNGHLQNVRVGNEETPSIIKQGNVSILMNKEGKLYIDEQNSDDVVVVANANGENARQVGIKELTPLFDGLAKEVQGMAVESIERGVRNADTFTQGTMIALPNGQAGIVQSVGEDGSIAMFDFQGNPITIAPQDTENARKVTFTEGMNVGGETIEGVREDGYLIVNGSAINPSEFASGMQQYLYDSAEQTPKAPIVTPQQAQEVQTNAVSAQLQQDIADAKELGDDFVNTMLTQAQKALDKASKQKPTGTDANSYRASKNKIDAQVAQAQAEVDRWLAVQQALTQEQIQNTINNEQNESPKVENANQVGNVARDKFVNSKRFEGNTSVRTLPNGTQIKGRYMLVSAESLTPSHNPLDNWNTSEGFPLNERGQNINDRDYKNDVSAQNETIRIAQQYGGQAVEQVPTVSPEGVVYDGNGRTMAGIIAAQNGTDASYIETLKANASNFGFTPQQVNEIPSARVVFVTDEVLPYTTQTFAQFNQQEKKTQSSTENAVAKSKSLDAQTISQLLSVVDSFATLDNFFTSPIACADMLKVLQEKGIIAPTEVAGLTETNKNGELVFNAHGREFITDVLIGANFTENVIRQMAGDKGLKQSVLRALNVIIANRKLGEFALTKHINNAISLIREANNAKLSVSLYLRQTNMFEVLATERYTAFEILMAEQLQSGVENFRELLSKYNNYARENQGGQTDMFAEGGLLSIEDITNIILEQYGYRTTQTEHAIQSSSRGENRANEEGIRERRQGNSEQQPNDTTELERKLLHLKEGESIKDFFERLKKTKQPILNRIQEWQNKVGVPVEVIINPTTIKNKIAYNEIAKGTNVKGWYDPNTGKAYIYLPNAESVKDVDETVMHEIIAHKGLRELLGKEKFDGLCDAVWDMMSEKQRAEKLAYLNSTGAHRNATQQERQRAAADEYIAFLAENVQLKEDLTVWESVVRKIKDILKSFGIKFRMSDEQLGELLRESARMFRDNARNASQNNEQDNAAPQFAEVNFRITYHGSGAKFDKFDRFAQRSGLIPNRLGVKGIYVSDSEEVGKNYALANRYRGEGKSHLYEVEIPEDNGKNYINWESKKWESLVRRVNEVLNGEPLSGVRSTYRVNDEGVVFETLRRRFGYDVDKLTSFLRDNMGIVGISYPSYYEEKNVDKDARSYVIFNEDDLQIKDMVSFRTTGGTLMGVHNISERKFKEAMKRGGFANPSFAVIDTEKQSFDNFGEISLIMPSSLVDPKASGNAGVFTGDIWSPTYPRISKQINDKGWKKIYGVIGSLVDNADIARVIEDSLHDYVEDNYHSRAEYAFLLSKGITPKIVRKSNEGYVSLKELEDLLGVNINDASGLDEYAIYKNLPKEKKEEFNLWKNVNGNKKQREEIINLLNSEPKSKATELRQKLIKEKTETELYFGEFDSFITNMIRKDRNNGSIDVQETLSEARQYCYENGLDTEYQNWLNELIASADPKEVFFTGYDYNGNPKYTKATLENISRYMKKEGVKNTNNDTGFDATRALLLQRLSTLNQIKSNKDLLQTSDEVEKEIEVLKNELFSIISQLADMQKISDNSFSNIDYANLRLQEALMTKNPIKHLNSEYGYKIEEKGEFAESLKEFTDKVKGLPAKYFEGKFERPVYLNEFVAAVVPNNISPSTTSYFVEANIPIYTYNPSVEGSRNEAILQAGEDVDGVRFRITSEMEDIKAKAQADGTFMKAPNGKPTNLNEKQWLQVRTDAFKKWFGDWEKVFRIEKLRKSAPVKVEFNNEYELNRDSAKQWMKDNLRGEYVNKDTDEKIVVSKIGINEVTSHGSKDEAHLISLVAIPQLIEDSIFIDEQVNTKDNDKYESYKYYVCGARINNDDYTIKIVIGVKDGVKYYDHRLTQIEKGKLIDNLNGLSNSVAENQNTLSEYKDTKLISILQTNSSKILDANGEPKVMYHGTPNEFNVFDQSKIERGNGFWFTSEISEAEGYAWSEDGDGNIVSVFLNAKKPATLEDVNGELLEQFRKQVGAKVSPEAFIKDKQATDFLRSKGYDAIMFDDKVIVYSPNQIKSATDNIGTFDSNNDDISFRVTPEMIDANDQFNEELQQQIDGTLPKGHIYQIGMPSNILRSAGVVDLPIELSAERLYAKSMQENHPFSLESVSNLPMAIQNPIAVFDSRTNKKSKVILTELQYDGNNFVVALRLRNEGEGIDLEVNSIQSLYPKDRIGGVIEWVNSGLLRYANKNKLVDFLTQSTNLIAGKETDLNDATKLIQNFEIPKLSEENFENNDVRFRVSLESRNRVDAYNRRGGWNKAKILRYLKENSTRSGVRKAARAIAEFDSAEELKEHMFYHGTKGGSDKLRPSITMTQRQVEKIGGGGYGQRYWGISVSKSKKMASAFSDQSYVRIYPIILLKDAKVIERNDFQDAIDVEDHIVELWEDGVDAVWIGNGKQGEGEQELLVLNPRAIVNIGTADFYKYYKLGTPQNPLRIADDKTIEKIYETSIRFADAQKPTLPLKPLRILGEYENDEEYLEALAEWERQVADIKASDAWKNYRDIENEATQTIRFRTTPESTPIFVSNALVATQKIKQEKATPQQWLAMIEKNAGIKAGEDKWLGLSDWLKSSNAKTLTKDEVLEYIRENMIDVQEVWYGETSNGEGKLAEFNAEFNAFYDETDRDLDSYERADLAFEEMVDKYGDDFRDAFGIENRGYEVELYPLEDLYWDITPTAKYFLDLDDENSINYTRLNYTTEGLDKKKEVVLTVPTIDSWNQSDAIHFGDAGDGRAVAWVRFGETYDADGNRVLVIDEIQSKRHQAGRDVGYADLKSYEKEKEILDEKASELLQRRNKLVGTLNEKYGDFTKYTKKIGETYSSKLVPNEDVLTSDEVKEWNETSQDVISEAQKELDKKYRSGVPDAPFEKNWQEVAMKRMMRYATENGFDKLAWTKGEQQAKRYALSNTVEVIHAEDSLSEMEDGTEIKKEIAITTTQDSIIRLYVDANGNVLSGEFKGKHLSEIVGKDVASRLMADGEVTLEPMDLEIGGEGMKGFYDKMLPSFINKYGKKWGVKVGEVTLPYVEEAGRTMHSIDITDTMKEQLDAEAQPMFRVIANPAALVNAPKPNEVGYENETFVEYLQRYEQWRNDKIAYENYTESEIPQFPSWDKDRMTFKQYLDAINDYKRGVEKLELVSAYNQAFFTKWKEFKEAMKTLNDTGHRIRAFYKWMKSQGADIDPRDNAYNDSHRRNSRMQHVLRVFEQNQKLNMMNAMNAILRSGKLDGLGLTWQNIDSDTTPDKERRNGTPLTRQEILSVYAQAKDCKEAKELGLPDRGENAFKNNLGMSYQDVIDAVEGAVDPRMIYNLWDAIKAVNDFALDYQLKYGMIDQATRDSLDRKFYVPERGWKVRDMDGKIDGYMPSKNGSKYSSFNPALVKAHGRTSLASDPFPYMLSIVHSSVVSTEKNRTLQALYRGLMKNERLGRETGAYKIRRIWGMIAKDENGNTIYDREGKPITLISYEAPTAEMYKHDNEIDEQVKDLRKENSKLRDEYVKATPTRQAEINQEVSDNNAKIKKLEESKYMTAMIEDTTIKYRTKNETQQHVIKLKVDGADVEIEFKDEKLANAINGGNWVSNMNDGWMKNTISRISKLTQKLSSWKTQYNYEFAVANFTRDLILSHMINGIREGEGFALKASKEVFASMGTIASYLSNGKNLDKMKDSKRKQYLQEFLENGALTGFSFTKPIEDISEELYKELMRLDGDNRTTQEKMARLTHLFAEKGENALAFLSELSEMSVRFAQYVTCRDAGKTIEASATSAKEITTNFDRKSQLGNAFGWVYGFFNAAIQGTMNIAYAVKDNPKRGAAMLSAWSAIFVGLGYVMASLFAPDDPEDETYLTEWDRWTNLTIPLPGKNTIVIPLPHVMRAFNALGVNMAMVEKGRKPLNQAIGDVVQFFLDELTPSSPLQIQNFADYNDRTGKWEMDFVKYAQGAMPTFIQPVMDVVLDRNFMNAPIAKRVWNDNVADIHRANAHTEQFFIDFTHWLNKKSGGDPNMETKYKGIDINPSNIKHILTGYGGGLPQLIIDTGMLIYNKAKGNDIRTGEVPFLRKVVRTYDDKKAYTSEYWNLKNKVDNYKAILKDASENSPETYDKLVSSEEYEAYVMAQGVLDEITKPKEATEFTQQDINDMIWANKMMNKGKVFEKPE